MMRSFFNSVREVSKKLKCDRAPLINLAEVIIKVPTVMLFSWRLGKRRVIHIYNRPQLCEVGKNAIRKSIFVELFVGSLNH